MSEPAETILGDLVVEGDLVEELVAGLDELDWMRMTPAHGWTVKHQIAHLLWTDDIAVTAATDPYAFRRVIETAMMDPAGHVHRAAEEGAALADAVLLQRWRERRRRLIEVLSVLPRGTKVPWFGPSMSGRTLAGERLMETWAHGCDIAEALNTSLPVTPRLRHVCDLAVRNRDFSYWVRGEMPPLAEVRVEIDGPDGDRWVWGPEHAVQLVTGSALDFSLLATRRRHRQDVAVQATGFDAEHWLGIIQAFVGHPGQDPHPIGADRV